MMNENSERWLFVPELGGERADVYLLGQIEEHRPGISRAQLRHWFDEGRILCDGKKIKSGEKTKTGRAFEVCPPDAVTLAELPMPQVMELDIRYEDDYLLVVNKPQGLVVHPAAGHAQDTLVNGLLYHYGDQLSDAQGVFRPGIVHRIDKDTSGLLLVVKDVRVHAKLANALRKHEIKRHYVALVYGHVTAESGTIDMPIGRAADDRQKMTVRADGRSAVTHFKIKEKLKSMTLLDLDLETGRTHQIRVHLKYIGHPVVADPVYAPRGETYGLHGQALHASALDFIHPVSGQAIHVEAELPDYFLELITRQRG